MCCIQPIAACFGVRFFVLQSASIGFRREAPIHFLPGCISAASEDVPPTLCWPSWKSLFLDNQQLSWQRLAKLANSLVMHHFESNLFPVRSFSVAFRGVWMPTSSSIWCWLLASPRVPAKRITSHGWLVSAHLPISSRLYTMLMIDPLHQLLSVGTYHWGLQLSKHGNYMSKTWLFLAFSRTYLFGTCVELPFKRARSCIMIHALSQLSLLSSRHLCGWSRIRARCPESCPSKHPGHIEKNTSRFEWQLEKLAPLARRESHENWKLNLAKWREQIQYIPEKNQNERQGP